LICFQVRYSLPPPEKKLAPSRARAAPHCPREVHVPRNQTSKHWNQRCLPGLPAEMRSCKKCRGSKQPSVGIRSPTRLISIRPGAAPGTPIRGVVLSCRDMPPVAALRGMRGSSPRKAKRYRQWGSRPLRCPMAFGCHQPRAPESVTAACCAPTQFPQHRHLRVSSCVTGHHQHPSILQSSPCAPRSPTLTRCSSAGHWSSRA